MKLIELEIENIRGIRHMVLYPQKNNFAIWGPNGSGKSAVVDAVDFLLTGDIIRLRGKGTGSMSLKKHGPHIGCDPASAKVRAVIQLHGHPGTIEISRCMESPKRLIGNGPDLALLEPILELARRGHHALTRREILRYVASEGNTRAHDIQELLNISEVEDIRKVLIRVKNDSDNERGSSQRAVSDAELSLCGIINLQDYNAKEILPKINQYRSILNGPPIYILAASEIKKGLVLPPAVAGKQTINVTLVENSIENLKRVLSPVCRQEMAGKDKDLRSLMEELRRDPHTLRAFSVQELIALGIDLIDDSGNCPLCEKTWSPGELRSFLEHRRKIAEKAQQLKENIGMLRQSLSDALRSPLQSLRNVISVASLLDLKEFLPLLQQWEKNIDGFLEDSGSPISSSNLDVFQPEAVAASLAPEGILPGLDPVLLTIKENYPDATPEQDAWDTLTKLEGRFEVLEKARQDFQNAELTHQRASRLAYMFETTRDEVIGSLYNEVSGRFVELYKILHEEDEKNFTARLKPDGASLDFVVDFHGKGIHPPQALHSEGHQDSMGLCLYLALVERLTGGLLDLIILDDVVMSVDADHRKRLCHLLATEFPDRQFLITTHDKTWSSQLKNEGVVQLTNMIEFYNWNIDTGPQVNSEAEIWDKMKQDLLKNDVSAAAAALRHGSEDFFSKVCDALQAPVKFRLNSKWEFGELLLAAMKQYKLLLKQAKNSAASWELNDLVQELNVLDSVTKGIFARTNAEAWAINENVHYNEWANFTQEDFTPVMEAFQDLFAVFACSRCQTILYLTTRGNKPGSVRCNCGQVDWNLIENKKLEDPHGRIG